MSNTQAFTENLRYGALFQNGLINGDFRISQRGTYTSATTITSTSNYFLDRWVMQGYGTQNGTATFYQKEGRLPNLKSLRIDCPTSGTTSTDYVLITQIIEDYSLYWNKTISAHAWVKSNSSSTKIRILINNTSVFDIKNHSGSGLWEYLDLSAYITTAVTTLSIQLLIYDSSGFSAGTYAEFTEIKLELGDVATPYIPRNTAVELYLCKRYYQCDANDFSYSYYRPPFYNTDGSTGSSIFIRPLEVAMRTRPTVSITNGLRGTSTSALNQWNVVEGSAYNFTGTLYLDQQPNNRVVQMIFSSGTFTSNSTRRLEFANNSVMRFNYSAEY